MDSSDPRMQLLQRWKDEGLLAKAGFIDAGAKSLNGGFLGTLDPTRKEVYAIPTTNASKGDNQGKNKGKKGKNHKNHELTEKDLETLNDLNRRNLQNHKTKEGGKQGGKHQKHKNEFLAKDWDVPKLTEEKASEINKLTGAVNGALVDIPASISFPAVIKEEVKNIIGSITAGSMSAALNQLGSLVSDMTSTHGIDGKKLHYTPCKIETLNNYDVAVAKSSLISKTIYLILKFIKLTKKSDPGSKYDIGDLKLIQTGLHYHRDRIDLINKAMKEKNPAGTSVEEPTPVASKASFGTGVFSMGKPFK